MYQVTNLLNITRSYSSVIYKDTPILTAKAYNLLISTLYAMIHGMPIAANSNDPCDLDFWPIDLEMAHDISPPNELYVSHMNIIHEIDNFTAK